MAPSRDEKLATELKEILAKQDSDLENTRAELAEIKEFKRPKSLAAIVSIIAAIVTTVWFLSSNIQARPTYESLNRVMDKHEDEGHSKINQNIQEIRERLVKIDINVQIMTETIKNLNEEIKSLKRQR